MKLQQVGNYKDGSILEDFLEIGNNENKIDLLIGANCLKAPKPLEVMSSQDKGPYVFRAALGWCVLTSKSSTAQCDFMQ